MALDDLSEIDQNPNTRINLLTLSNQEGSISTIDEEALINHAMNLWEESKNAREEWERKLNDYIKLLLGVRSPKTFPWKNAANLHVPLTMIVKNSLQANLIKSFFSVQDPIQAVPQNMEDARNSETNQRYMNYQFANEIDWYSVLNRGTDNTLSYGNGYLKVRWDRERDAVAIDNIDPEDLFVTPDANASPETASGIFHQTWLPKHVLRQLNEKRIFLNVDSVKVETVINPSDAQRRETADEYQGIDTTSQVTIGRVHVVEGYMDWPLKPGADPVPVIVQFNPASRTLLRVVQNKSKYPRGRFVNLQAYPFPAAGPNFPSRWYAMPVAQMIESVQKELNFIHNSRVDNGTLKNAPFFFFEPAAGFDPKKYQIQPGKGIPVMDSGGVSFPAIGDVPPSQFNEEQLLWNYAERLTGASPNMQGRGEGMGADRATATGTIAKIERGTILFDMPFKNILNTIQTRLLPMVDELNQVNLPPKKQLRVLGAQGTYSFVPIKRATITGNFDYRLNIKSQVSVQADRQMHLLLYQTFAPFAQQMPEFMLELMREVLTVFDKPKLISKLPQIDQMQLLDPQEENNLMIQGQPVQVQPLENLQKHLAEHQRLVQSEIFIMLDSDRQQLVLAHVAETERRMAAVQQAQQTVNGATARQDAQPPAGSPLSQGGAGGPSDPLRQLLQSGGMA